MGFFDWLWGKRKPKARTTDAAPDLELMMRMAEKMERQGPKRPLFYLFQHRTLPEAVFQNHPELIQELAGDPSEVRLQHFRSRAVVSCAEAGLFDPDDERADAELEAQDDLFDSMTVHPYRRGGYTVYVVTMPTPEESPEAHFVAIVHKDDEPHEYTRESPSTRYFTLEKSFEPDHPMLCEWTRDGTHANLGDRPPLSRDAFAEEVFRVMSVR